LTGLDEVEDLTAKSGVTVVLPVVRVSHGYRGSRGNDREAIDWHLTAPGARRGVRNLRADVDDVVEGDFARFGLEDSAAFPPDDALHGVEGKGFAEVHDQGEQQKEGRQEEVAFR